MKAETKRVLATCFRRPARSTTLTGRPQNAIASAHRKWLIFGKFGGSLSDLESIKNFLARFSRPPMCSTFVPRCRSRTQSKENNHCNLLPPSKLQVLPSLKPIPPRTANSLSNFGPSLFISRLGQFRPGRFQKNEPIFPHRKPGLRGAWSCPVVPKFLIVFPVQRLLGWPSAQPRPGACAAHDKLNGAALTFKPLFTEYPPREFRFIF